MTFCGNTKTINPTAMNNKHLLKHEECDTIICDQIFLPFQNQKFG